jgi:tRNA (guanine37-N1)-methyltransferase
MYYVLHKYKQKAKTQQKAKTGRIVKTGRKSESISGSTERSANHGPQRTILLLTAYFSRLYLLIFVKHVTFADVMRIDILTCIPEMIEGFLNVSILKRAQEKGLAEIHLHNLHDYAHDKRRNVDDEAYGGMAGMVMKIQPIEECIEKLESERHYDEIIFTSPDGEQFTQPMANQLSMKENIIILCGHFKGVDQRVRDHFITKEISVGDYVLTGGELPAAIIADAIVRIVPGVISDDQSALSDCFQDNLLSAPIYTRPADYKGWKVPDILLSGNDAKIKDWELEQSYERTKRLRPDLLK